MISKISYVDHCRNIVLPLIKKEAPNAICVMCDTERHISDDHIYGHSALLKWFACKRNSVVLKKRRLQHVGKVLYSSENSLGIVLSNDVYSLSNEQVNK